MKRRTLLATSALWLLGGMPAIADGMGGKNVTGFGDIGYMYNDYDAS